VRSSVQAITHESYSNELREEIKLLDSKFADKLGEATVEEKYDIDN
jgi:hypothetical protein